MAREFFTAIDLNNNRLLEAVLTLENVASGSAPNAEAGRIIHDSGTVKYHNGSAWVSLGAAGAGVADTRQIIAGAGLTGGGDLSTDRTLNVVSANADMTVAADSITIVSAPKWTTGRTITLSGDVSGSVASVDGSAAINISNMAIGAGVIVDADVNATAAIATSKISGLDTALTGKAATTTDLTAGAGLTGGGTLAANRTFAVGAGTGITVNADDVAINRTTVDAWYVDVGGDTLTGYLVTHADPVSDMQVANKRYVDLTAQGLDFKNSVKAASTANLTLSAPQTVDGIGLIAGDRVLVKDQSTPAQNGIYTVAAGAWVRATDADANGEISDGTLVPVEGGTVNADSHWIVTSTTATPWVPASSGSTWTRFLSASDLIAGAGLTKTGNTLDVVSANADMTVGANDITIVSAPKWTTGRTITLTGDVTGVSGAFDGTGNLSFAATIATGVIMDADINASAAIQTSKIAGLDAALAGAGKRFATNVTGGAGTFNVDHNLNTLDVVVQVYVISTGASVELDVTRTTVNRVVLTGTPTVPAGLRVVVLG